MAFRRYESILAECVDAMQIGATVEDCLERYPQQAERLRPALLLAERVSQTPLAQARPNAQAAGWKKVEKRLAELQSGKQPATFTPSRVLGGNYGAWLRPVAIGAVAVLAVSAVSGGTVLASQSAMPSSPLYRVKLAGEDVRVWFISDDVHKANVLLDQSQQRMEEINDTVKDGDAVPENALSALENRNRDAYEIQRNHPDNYELLTRVKTQAAEQEGRLLALWQEVPTDAQGRYSEVVADLHNTQLGGGTGAAVAALQPEELIGGILTISGQLETTGGDQWSVGGFEVRIDSQTLHDQPQPGSTATVLAARSSNGRLHALNLSNILVGSADSASSTYVSGVVEEVTDDGVRIAGQLIPFDADTLQTSPIRAGQKISVQVKNTENGVVAGQVTPSSANDDGTETFWFEGTIQGDVSRATSRWTVGGLQFDITPSTGFDARAGSAANGIRVQIEAVASGTDLLARRVTVLNSKTTSDTSSVIGTFDGYVSRQEGIWKISGLPVTASPDIVDDPSNGALIMIDTRPQEDHLLATGFTVIETTDGTPLVQLQGTILETHGSRWKLEIGEVHVPSSTKVIGKVESGKRVIVWGYRGDDGIIECSVARILDDSPVVQVSSEPTPTQVPDVSGAAP